MSQQQQSSKVIAAPKKQVNNDMTFADFQRKLMENGVISLNTMDKGELSKMVTSHRRMLTDIEEVQQVSLKLEEQRAINFNEVSQKRSLLEQTLSN